MAGSPPNLHKMDSRSACIQGVLKVKVKGHVIRALSWILGMSNSVIGGLVLIFRFCFNGIKIFLLTDISVSVNVNHTSCMIREDIPAAVRVLSAGESAKMQVLCAVCGSIDVPALECVETSSCRLTCVPSVRSAGSISSSSWKNSLISNDDWQLLPLLDDHGPIS